MGEGCPAVVLQHEGGLHIQLIPRLRQGFGGASPLPFPASAVQARICFLKSGDSRPNDGFQSWKACLGIP